MPVVISLLLGLYPQPGVLPLSGREVSLPCRTCLPPEVLGYGMAVPVRSCLCLAVKPGPVGAASCCYVSSELTGFASVCCGSGSDAAVLPWQEPVGGRHSSAALLGALCQAEAEPCAGWVRLRDEGWGAHGLAAKRVLV